MTLRFSEPQRTETLTLRVTPEEKDYLAKTAAARQTTVAGVVRQALDLLLAQSSASGSSDAGSSTRPASTANDKATGKRSPSKSQKRTQSSH